MVCIFPRHLHSEKCGACKAPQEKGPMTPEQPRHDSHLATVARAWPNHISYQYCLFANV